MAENTSIDKKKLEDTLENSKEFVRGFVWAVLGDIKKDSKDKYVPPKDLFEKFFKNFSFDWLNHDPKMKGKVYKEVSIGEEEIEKTFCDLTRAEKNGILNEITKDNKWDSGEADGVHVSDPDNMMIIRNILFILYFDFLSEAYIEYGNKEKDIMNDDIFFRGDTINSLHTEVGVPDIKGEYIFLYDEIRNFNKNEKEFFNMYHTLGNFIPLPNERIYPDNKKTNYINLNQYRKNLKGDNFGAFLDLLEEVLPLENENKLEKILKENTLYNGQKYWKNLFCNNTFFFKGFKNVEDYCERFNLNRAMFKKRDDEMGKCIEEEERKKRYIEESESMIEERGKKNDRFTL